MTPEAFLGQLTSVFSHGPSRWSARCPAHDDKSPSLSIREANKRILVFCFAGCKPEEIVAALGLEMRDLFTDTPISQGQRPTQKPQKLDLTAIAYYFQLAALDRRLRADAVLHAVAAFTSDELSDSQRDQIMPVVAGAYADLDRAEFLETMADSFRLKEWDGKRRDHAA